MEAPENECDCASCDHGREVKALRAEVERLHGEYVGHDHWWVALDAARKERDAALLQVRAFEEAKVKDLEALHDLLEVLAPFYLHAKALWNARRLVNRVADISKQGDSSLVAGAFVNVIEVYKKWGDIADAFIEKPQCEPDCRIHHYIVDAEKRIQEPPIENPQALGNCMKCGAPRYSDHGYCGGCR